MMEEILRQLIGSLSHYLRIYTSQVVQDFLHQQYIPLWERVHIPPKEKVIFNSVLVGIMFVSRRVYRLYISEIKICRYVCFESYNLEMKKK